MTRMSFAAIAALALLLTACGGQGNEYSSAIATSIQQDSGGLQISDDQSQCVGDTFVDVVGVDAFQNAGVTPDDIRGGASPLNAPGQLGIDEPKARMLFNGLDECIDVNMLVTQTISQRTQLPPAQQQCLSNALDKELLRKLFVAQITGQNPQSNPALTKQLVGAYSQCVGQG